MENEFAKRLSDYKESDNSILIPQLFDYLKKIEDFYYSDFWINRLQKRIEKELLDLDDIDISIILGTISLVLDNIDFRIDLENELINDSSKKHTIYINLNMNEREVNNSHLYNLIIHESGHLIYNHVKLLEKLNKSIFLNPSHFILKELNEVDMIYFTDTNELRQRIFPVVVEMKVNNWTLEETYFNSPNLIKDNIYKLYPKEYIIHLIENIV